MIDLSTIVFLTTIVILAVILVFFQRKDDDFDLRDIICSWNGKTRAVSTSKTLLAGTFLVSSYYLIKNPTEISYGAYLAAWVANSGVKSWQSVKLANPKKIDDKK